MINICLLFGIFPASLKEKIEINSKGSIQYAADALQKSIIAGVTSLFDRASIVNIPFISSFPKYYKKIVAPSGIVDATVDGIEGKSYSYMNLPLLKFYSKRRNAIKGLNEWGSNVQGNKVIIIYSAHSPLIKAAVAYKKRCKDDVKLILIVPDLPEYMSQKRNFAVEILKKIDGKNLWKLYNKIDGFVLLTEYMKERLPICDKPYNVIEGIFNPLDLPRFNNVKTKTVFYSGTLAKRYGIMNLVHAFIQANKTEFVLEICGKGDAEEEICQLATCHSNIHYLGQLTREEVLNRQRQATLLVNPRTPEGEFTRYSFPSKTMEYLASGVPTLLYKLPGIPEEYYNYCFTISELGVDALADKIKEILELPEIELNQLGKEAQKFILSEKNPSEQCKKLFELVNVVVQQS